MIQRSASPVSKVRQLKLRHLATLQDVIQLIKDWSVQVPKVFNETLLPKYDIDTAPLSGEARVRPGQARLVSNGSTIYLDNPSAENIGQTTVVVIDGTGSISVRVLSGAALVEDQSSLSVSTSGGWAFGRNTFMSFGVRGWWRI